MNYLNKARSLLACVMVMLACMAIPGMSLSVEVTIGEFPEIDRLERELERGVSTAEDIERVLGKPSGYGRALSGIDGKHRDVWYYEEIEASVIESKGGVIRMHAHQQILLIFLLDEKLDGFQWYSNAGAVKGTGPSLMGDTEVRTSK